MTGQEFAEVFSSFCNDSRREPKTEAIDVLLREHRTIQQNVMRFCVSFIEKMAEQRSDLRNQASVDLANEFMKIDSAKRALPYV